MLERAGRPRIDANRGRLAGAALLAMMLGSGCASFSSHLMPRPTPEDKVEVHATIDVLGTKTAANKAFVVPVAELGLRFGISEYADIGGKISVSKLGGELNSRISLVQSESFDLALVPLAGLALASVTSNEASGLIVSFGMPILAGINFSERFTLILGGKFIAQLAAATVGNIDPNDPEDIDTEGNFILYPGGVVGFGIKLGESLRLLPEVNMHIPINLNTNDTGEPVWQGGLSFQFLTDA